MSNAKKNQRSSAQNQAALRSQGADIAATMIASQKQPCQNPDVEPKTQVSVKTKHQNAPIYAEQNTPIQVIQNAPKSVPVRQPLHDPRSQPSQDSAFDQEQVNLSDINSSHVSSERSSSIGGQATAQRQAKNKRFKGSSYEVSVSDMFNMANKKTQVVLPTLKERYKITATSFFGWVQPIPNRMLYDITQYIGQFFKPTPVSNLDYDTEIEGFQKKDTVNMRYVDPNQTGTLYFSPTCIFRTPFSYGSFLDFNCLSMLTNYKRLQFNVDLLFMQYYTVLKTNQRPMFSAENYRILFGRPADKENKIPAQAMSAEEQFIDNHMMQPHCIMYTTPFTQSPYDVLLSSALCSVNEFNAKSYKGQDGLTKFIDSTLFVLREALDAMTNDCPQLNDILSSPKLTYFTFKQSKFFDASRVILKQNFEIVQKKWESLFTIFNRVYRNNGITMPEDFKQKELLVDADEQLKLLKGIASAIKIDAMDYSHHIRLVNIESITPGDYCGQARREDAKKNLHGDMTGGFNGFAFQYIMFEKSHKVVAFKISNNFKAPYLVNGQHPNTIKCNSGQITRMFGGFPSSEQPFVLDTSCLENITQNPEYMFLQAYQPADGFYTKNENLFTSKLYVTAYSEKEQQDAFAEHAGHTRLFSIEKGFGGAQATVQNFKRLVNDSVQQGSIPADKFMHVLGKNVNHLRAPMLSTVGIIEDLDNLVLPTVGTIFQKFNWLQAHRYVGYQSSATHSRKDIPTCGVQANFGDTDDYPKNIAIPADLMKTFDDLKITTLYDEFKLLPNVKPIAIAKAEEEDEDEQIYEDMLE